MKRKNKTFYLDDKIYGSCINVVIGNYRYFNSHMKNKYNVKIEEEIINTQDGTTILLDSRNIIIYIKKIDNSIQSYTTISHEVLHATLDTLQQVGIVLDYENQEVITFFHDYLFRQFLEKIKGK